MLRKRRKERTLRGSRVLITGASSGIGLECARRLSAAGADLALVARGEEGLRKAAATIDGPVVLLPADVTDPGALRPAVDTAVQRLGGLDAAVVNAGAAAYGPFRELDPEDHRRTIDTTLVGALNTVHALLPALERSGGTVVIVGSVAGRLATPWLSAYTAAKHGLRGFARTLQAELRAQDVPVQVALVAPGPVDTQFWRVARTPDGRRPPKLAGVYAPEEVASEVLRALRDPRMERTIGGLFRAWIAFDELAPNLALRITSVLARLGWRRRGDKPLQGGDSLSGSQASPRTGDDLPSRPSALRALRDRIGTQP
jgi:NAD(P)-dependent dehydrogenase (short-subunit alcohol dehydrogenase family)